MAGSGTGTTALPLRTNQSQCCSLLTAHGHGHGALLSILFKRISGRWRATTESRCESAVSDCRPSVRPSVRVVLLLGTSTPKRSKGESETDGCVRVWSKKVDMTFRVETTLWRDGRNGTEGTSEKQGASDRRKNRAVPSGGEHGTGHTHSGPSNPVTSPLGTLVGSRAFDVTW